MGAKMLTVVLLTVISSMAAPASDCGGCSQKCLPLSNSTALCSCRQGYQLNSTDLSSCYGKAEDECSDPEICSRLCEIAEERSGECVCAGGYTASGECMTVGYDVFLLCARLVELQVISMDGPELDSVALPVSEMLGAYAIDYHAQTDSIFWTDVLSNTISTAKINGSGQHVIISNLTSPTGISVDWVSHKLYWTNVQQADDTIEVAELDGSDHFVLIDGLENPSDIVVHPMKKILFWSTNGVHSKIERANLDGTERTPIVTNLIQPHGLALDFDLQRLYWCNTDDSILVSSLEYVNFDGSGRKALLSEIQNSIFFALSLYGDYLYWTDLSDKSIQIIHKNTGEERATIMKDLVYLYDIQLFSRDHVSSGLAIVTGQNSVDNSSSDIAVDSQNVHHTTGSPQFTTRNLQLVMGEVLILVVVLMSLVIFLVITFVLLKRKKRMSRLHLSLDSSILN